MESSVHGMQILRMKAGILSAVAVLFVFTGIVTSQESLEPKQASPASPIALAPWVLHSKLTHELLPKYPNDAGEHHIQGDITVDVVVDKDGNVESATWVNDGTSIALRDATLEAVRQWKYRPTLVNGEPVAVASWLVIRFRLLKAPVVKVLTRAASSSPAKKARKITLPLGLRWAPSFAERNLIQRVEPVYPADIHVDGNVVLEILIDREGNVTEAVVVSGHPLLIGAALDAVKQWKYRPYVFKGEPVMMETAVTVNFQRKR